MWRNRSVLLCRAEATRDGNVDRIGREILDGFRANGWFAVDILLPATDAMPVLVGAVSRIERGEFDLVLSVQNMGLFGGPEIDAIMARGHARRIYWALDHPYSCWQQVAGLAANVIVTYPTRSNSACCRKFLRSDIAPITIAHGAMPREAAPWSGRDIPALFVGNAPATPPDKMRREWSQRFPARWAKALEDMADRFDPFKSDSLDGLAVESLAARGIDTATIKRDDIMLLLGTFDAYAWARTRLDYVLGMQDVPITLVGRGWDGIAGPAMKPLGPLPTDQARALMDRARLVLNLQSQWFQSHERVFEGMAAGCAVAAVATDTIANAMGAQTDPADECAIFRLGPPDGAGDRLNDLLNDASRLNGVAEAGHAEQNARHTWAHRVKSLLDAVAAG